METKVPSEPKNIYRDITAKIVKAMQDETGTFKMPWRTGADTPAFMPVNAATDAYYRGVNVLSLWIDAMRLGYPSGQWASYRQWLTLGSQVRKGERGSLIIFYKPVGDRPEDTEELAPPRYIARASYVFNAAQVDGWQPPLPLRATEFETNSQVDAFVHATQARVRHGFAMARYRRDLDDIEMPAREWFTGAPSSSALQSYYAVLLHELTHWSGASHRLDRTFGKRFGDKDYAFEELIAELGAAFLCATLEIANEPRPDHAVYLRSWLDVLNNDHRAIFMAARYAQEAVQYLGNLAVTTIG